MRSIRTFIALMVLSLAGAVAQNAIPRSAEFSYEVSLADAPTHLLHVQMQIPAGTDTRVVRMPVWNALYQVRDFAQYIESISATDIQGKSIQLEQIETSAWRISGAQNGAVVSYDIYVEDPGSFGAQVDEHHAFLNLAQVLLYEPGQGLRSKLQVQFTGVPAGWSLASALSGLGSIVNAKSYDQLVDSPIELGRFRQISFQDGHTDYSIVIDADSGDYDDALVESSVRRIVRAETDWMKDQPCARYIFIYHFPHGQGGGGMEHACSTAIDIPAERMRGGGMSAFDGVTAHEFFHQWNVKRIRPQSLEPIDYTREQDTRALWFSEGVTSTVEDIVLLRAGLITSQEYLNRLSSSIDTLQERPAHKIQSVEEASLQAWFEKYPFYRRSERSISYYNKGEIVGVMLDLAVRQATSGDRSLRDVFLWMNENYAKKGKYFDDSEGVRVAVQAVTGKDFTAFFANYVTGTEEIPYNEFLRVVGFRVDEQRIQAADPGFVVSRNFDRAPTVLSVEEASDAQRAGLKVGDTIVTINGKTMVGDALASLRPDDSVHLRVHSRGREKELKFTAGTKEVVHYAIVDVEHPTDTQMQMRADWLSISGNNNIPANQFLSPFATAAAPKLIGAKQP